MKTQPCRSVLRPAACTLGCVWLLLLCWSVQPTWAQGSETGDSIRINPKFLEELDRAFSFDPIVAPIEAPDDVLTREQLHEWVGPVEGALPPVEGKGRRYDPTDPNRFDSTYFALKMYLVDFCRWQPVTTNAIQIPGLGPFSDGLQHYGKYAHSVAGGGVGCTLDVNALSKYLRPSQVRLRKSRALAASVRDSMERAFPMKDPPSPP